jgi:riboflavin biosynthesis pyrimidine reductase
VVRLRVLHPTPAEASVDELYGAPRPRVDGRPWVGICMIASLDGTTVVDGRSGALGNAEDTAVLGALRRAADVVLVGAGTVRAEGYGAPKQPSLRIGVVTRTGDVDVDTELFHSGAGFLVLPEDGPSAPAGVDVVRAGRGTVDLGLALRRLGEVVDDPRFVQCEGGSRLNGSLLAAGDVDEVDLTISPLLAGGDGPRVTSGAPPQLARFELAHLATAGGYLFGRWLRAGLSPAPTS